MRVIWTAPALRDLESIGDYFKADNAGAAARVVAMIFERVEALAAHPHLGRAGRVPETRELVVSNSPWIVPYRVRDAKVEILAVFHGARRWPEMFG